MQNSIILQNLSQQELEQIIDSKFSELFSKLKKDLANQSDGEQLMTRDETCAFLSINSSTLWEWTRKGKVKAYAIGARRYYKKSELLESIIPVQ